MQLASTGAFRVDSPLKDFTVAKVAMGEVLSDFAAAVDGPSLQPGLPAEA